MIICKQQNTNKPSSTGSTLSNHDTKPQCIGTTPDQARTTVSSERGLEIIADVMIENNVFAFDDDIVSKAASAARYFVKDEQKYRTFVTPSFRSTLQ